MATVKSLLAKVWPSTNDAVHKSEISTRSSENDGFGYNKKVDEIRDLEYPMLVGTTYLDHAGTTPYAKSAVESWTAELTTNLFGNPHSASAASQLSTRRVDDTRLKVLKFFKASPDDFDVVFVANATAAIKLVAEAFRDNEDGFWFGFHADAHTSLVGCRELADRGSSCFQDEESLEAWVSAMKCPDMSTDTLQLVAYPGQSNMTGRRIPMRYCKEIRKNVQGSTRRVYTLLDAASLVSTSPLDLSDTLKAPDFTALSFYKIFGLPDLGALIIRKASAEPLLHKRYFAGGTVDGVALSEGGWHVKKPTLHGALEEGTLPFHNILALDHAMNVHQRLFGSMEDVSKHTRYLARQARDFLRDARHANGQRVCDIYSDWNETDHGPIVTFNLKNNLGSIISASEVEKLCIVKGIQLRTGGLCNPGGVARHLGLSIDQIRSNYNAGRRCGGESELIDGRPTGVIRISFGAMSTKADLHSFTSFIEEYYVERDVLRVLATDCTTSEDGPFLIESLSVYPIKSCGAFTIPPDQRWQLTAKGLAWDREWCLVHEGTNVALSQKKYPRMTLLQPTLDLAERKLVVSYDSKETTEMTEMVEIDLDEVPTIVTSTQTCSQNTFRLQNSKICGDTVPIQVYGSATVNGFFSRVLGVPCCLGRYPRDTTHSRNVSIREPSRDMSTPTPSKQQPQLMLSNESPILIVSSSSVDELNRQIRQNAQQENKPVIEVSPSSFRANIVVGQQTKGQMGSPYVEDTWTSISIASSNMSTKPADSHSPSTPTRLSHSSDTHSDTSASPSITDSIPGSFSTVEAADETDPTTLASRSTSLSLPNTSQDKRLTLDILGPCQRCQMLSINQSTALSQQEPFSTLVKTRRKGDGRVWFGVHASLAASSGGSQETEVGDVYVKVGDLVVPKSN